MSDAFHRELVAESRADGAVLHELGQHIGALHGLMSTARRADVDDLRREFEALREGFERLHEQDMNHALNQNAHRSWRARARRLAARVDELAGVAAGTAEHHEAAD